MRPGETFHLHVSTAPAQSYRVEISRLGWYTTATPPVLACIPSCSGSKPGVQRSTSPQDALGKVDAGWPKTDSFTVPPNWSSGVYGARLVLTSGPYVGKGRIVPIVVREPAGQHSAILVQASVATWQAYNSWGGKNLYDTAGIARAHAVSYNRPYSTFFTGGQSYFDWEIQLSRFLEREGYDVSYTTDVDVARDPGSLLGHKLVVTSGHDEYWNTSQRDAFEAARDANPPVNLAFFSANTSYWHVRYADDFRTEIAYKDAGLDPEPNPAEKTVQFRDLSPPRPECRLMGVQDQNALISGTVDYTVTGASLGDAWFNTTGLNAGDTLRGLVGYEFDGILPGCLIAGSTTTPLTQFFHYQAGPGRPPADATRYTAPSGARVFASGTFALSWALDGFGTNGNYVNPRVQQFARNLFDDLSGRTVLPPSAVTQPASAIGQGTATLNARVVAHDQETSVSFEYGPDTSYGSRTPEQSAGSGDGTIDVSAAVSGLPAGAIQHFRVVATNATGTARGADGVFRTLSSGDGAAYPQAVLGDTPAAYWRLSETSGTTTADEVGLSTGTFIGNVQRGVAGAIPGDGAAGFGGTAHVSVPNTPALATGDVFTVESWVKPSKLGITNGILYKVGAYMLYLDPGNHILLRHPNAGTLATSTATIGDTTRWHHVVVTKSGPAIRLYLDGTDVTGAVSPATVPVSTSPLWIGAGASQFRGAIDEVAIYPRVLSASTVAAHYAAQSGTGPLPASGPSVTGAPSTSITGSSATLNGSVDPRGQQTSAWFEYGTDTTYGSQTPTQNAGSGSGAIPVTAGLTGLAPATMYHARLVASNPSGTTRGPDQAFTTLSAPVVTTSPASDLTQSSAKLNGSVNPRGQQTSTWFEYGADTAYGSQTSAVDAGAGSSAQPFSATLGGLAPGTTLHFRIVASNLTGTSSGGDQSFITPAPGAGGYPQAVLQDNPVSYWRFGESGGSVAGDAVGLSPGSYIGSVSYGVAGPIAGDSAVRLDGKTANVQVPDQARLRTGDTFTLEAWIKPAHVGIVNGILARGASYQFYLDAANHIVLRQPNVGSIATSTAAVGDTTFWHHIAVTKSGATVRIYLDGVNVTGVVTNRTVSAAAGTLVIGAGAARFTGAIDEVAIYGTALSASTVANHFASR